MKRGFKSLKFLIVLSCLVLTTIIKPTTVSAKIDEQDNLKVRLKVEQVKGSKEEVKGTISISNIGIRPIKDIKIKTVIPESVIVKNDSTLEQNVGNLMAGESKTYEFFVNVPDQHQPITEGEPDIDTAIEQYQPLTEGEPDINISNTIKNVKAPELGDNSIFLILLVIVLIALGLLLFLRRKDIKKFLTMFLLFILLLPLFGGVFFVSASEQELQSISLEEKIVIRENTYVFKSIVSYKPSDNSVTPSGDIELATLFWTNLIRTRNYFHYSSYPANFRVLNTLYSTGVR